MITHFHHIIALFWIHNSLDLRHPVMHGNSHFSCTVDHREVYSTDGKDITGCYSWVGYKVKQQRNRCVYVLHFCTSWNVKSSTLQSKSPLWNYSYYSDQLFFLLCIAFLLYRFVCCSWSLHYCIIPLLKFFLA